jgi:hypothetical protein
MIDKGSRDRGIGLVRSVETGSSAVEVRLSSGLVLTGVVTGDNDVPIAKAVVTAIYAEHSRFFDAISDEHGKFRIGPVLVGTYSLVDFHEPLLPDGAYVAPASAGAALTLQLLSPRRISGKVLQAGAPVAGAQVVLVGDTVAPRPSPIPRGRSPSRGSGRVGIRCVQLKSR